MNDPKLVEMLIRHEGWKNRPYECTEGYLTIGIGRNLESRGLSNDEVYYLFKNDLKAVWKDLNHNLPWWQDKPETIQYVLVDMCFNLGIGGLLRFKKMLAACREEDWHEMAKEMKDSKWYGQVTERAQELINMVLKLA